MKKLIILILGVSLLFAACSSPKEKIVKGEIIKIQDSLEVESELNSIGASYGASIEDSRQGRLGLASDNTFITIRLENSDDIQHLFIFHGRTITNRYKELKIGQTVKFRFSLHEDNIYTSEYFVNIVDADGLYLGKEKIEDTKWHEVWAYVVLPDSS